MIIQHNILSTYGQHVYKTATGRNCKSTEKLSSGYTINRAGDDAAHLAISEKMRGQIRGLERASMNMAEACDYLKTAEGSLNEITSMVQRMRELTVQALNDTNTEDDKEMIQTEINQLQSEIGRMSHTSEYNTMDVYSPHEPSYSTFNGTKVWDGETNHNILSPDNVLKIYLDENLNPSEIDITVPEGNYTTYELIETLEELMEHTAPENTYFTIGYQSPGTCTLQFEGSEGLLSIGGGLANLFYDFTSGQMSGELIGTTQFFADYPLKIVQGKNDELSFQVQSLETGAITPVSIFIPEGEYSLQETIDELNRQLGGRGSLEAKVYNGNSIVLSAGADIITGLKGNMFQIDTGAAYDSVFYDNARYGGVQNTNGAVYGRAYYHSNYCDKIGIVKDANDKLRFKLKDDADYIELSIPEGNYTITELQTALNTALGSNSSRFSFSVNKNYVSSSTFPSAYYDYLKLTSLEGGNTSEIVFDTGSTVSEAAYKSLFCDTSVTRSSSPDNYYGSGATFTGGKTLSGSISLSATNPNLTISLNGGLSETIDLNKNYNNLTDLINDINQKINTNSNLSGKIMASNSSGKISFTTPDSSITSISCNGTSYNDLLVGEQYNYYSYNDFNYGTSQKVQGSTQYTETPASITLSHPLSASSVTIDSTNNTLQLYVNNKTESITVPNGPYSASSLISAINGQFSSKNIGVRASLDGNNRVVFTTTKKGTDAYISFSSSNSSLSRALMTPGISTVSPSSSSLLPARLFGKTDVSSGIKITSENKDFNFTYHYIDGNGTTKNQTFNIVLEEKDYTSSQLISALQAKIDAVNPGLITVSTQNNGIALIGNSNGSGHYFSSMSGGFYNNVMYQRTKATTSQNPVNVKGTSSFTDAYVVGRADLKNNGAKIKAGINDVLTIDYTYPKADGTSTTLTLSSQIPAGTYTGDEIATILQTDFNNQLQQSGITDFYIQAKIGGINTGVIGANDANALNFTLKKTVPDTTPVSGAYILDGVSGSAAYTVFYKTSGLPTPASVTGNIDLSSGVTITNQNNSLGFDLDGIAYDFTIPNGTYTKDEFLSVIQNLLTQGDEDGEIPKLEASIEDNHLKLEYPSFGSHPISRIRGTGVDSFLFQMTSQGYTDPMRIQVGANGGQEIALNKIALSTTLLKLDSVPVTQHTYAKYTLKHLDYALNYINGKRSICGAKFNRFESAILLADNSSENLQTSESRIRDTDTAKETLSQSKTQIIMQASQSILAQTNFMTRDGVSKLLSVQSH